MERELEGGDFWQGGWSGGSCPSDIWRGREKLEGGLERERGRDKISDTGACWTGGGWGYFDWTGTGLETGFFAPSRAQSNYLRAVRRPTKVPGEEPRLPADARPRLVER